MQTQKSLKTVTVFISLEERVLSPMHRCKPPVVERSLPSENERYDLNNTTHWRQLGISLKAYLPRADEYDHYPHCKWAIIECKGNSLRNSIEQLEFTAKQLVAFQKDVNLAIIIAGKINKKEKKYFTKKGNTLFRKKDNKPVLIPTGLDRVPVSIYAPFEIEKQYQEFGGTLDKWRS
jgi:hypothetical protein